MKKYLIILLIFLLTGCGESEKSVNDAKNPEEFIIEMAKEHSGMTPIIDEVQKHSAWGKYSKYYTFKMHYEEDPEITFIGSTYWYKVVTIFPRDSYTFSVADYENKKNNKILSEYFADKNIGFETEQLLEQLNKPEEVITPYTFIFNITDENILDKISEMFYDIQCNYRVKSDSSNYNVKSIPIHIKVCYFTESKEFEINGTLSLEYYKGIMDSLKNNYSAKVKHGEIVSFNTVNMDKVGNICFLQ